MTQGPTELSCVVGSGTTQIPKSLPMVVFGEITESVRSILKRYTLVYSNQQSPLASSYWQYYRIQLNPLQSSLVLTPFQLMSRMFFGCKGSAKYNVSVIQGINPTTVGANATPSNALMYLHRIPRATGDLIATQNFTAFGGTHYPVFSYSDTGYVYSSSGDEIVQIDKSNATFLLPDYNSSLFRYANCNSTTATQPLAVTCGSYQYALLAIQNIQGASTNLVMPIVNIHHAIGEDFNFVHFIGACNLDFGA